MIASRREILKTALALPFMVGREETPAILAEGHCLSRESARGFRSVSQLPRNVVIAAGWRDLNHQAANALRRRVRAGAFLLFESAPDCSLRQAHLLASEFQLGVKLGMRTDGEWQGDYVAFCQPEKHWVRPFLTPVAVHCRDARVLAQINGVPVAVERRMGAGRIVFLGSMLGPNLLAGEREAREVVAALLRGARRRISDPALTVESVAGFSPSTEF